MKSLINKVIWKQIESTTEAWYIDRIVFIIGKLAKNNNFYGIFLYRKVKIYNKNDIIGM